MKYSVLDFLGCSKCHGPLRLRVFEEITVPAPPEGNSSSGCKEYCAFHKMKLHALLKPEADCEACMTHEIISGVLECECGMWFPIIRGVPRMLPTELRHTSLTYYPGFFQKYEEVLPTLQTEEKDQVAEALEVKGKEDTIYRFSYEWNEFKDYDDDNFSVGIGPIGEGFFYGKRVLDAGCGAGRHAREAIRLGAIEVCAMDISNSVDAAFDNTRSSPGIHVIQGDIFNPPFRKMSFDLIYSLWALPHTHNPPLAFHSLVLCLRPTGSIVVYLYNSQRWLSYMVLGLMRKVTTKLPNPVVRGIAFAVGLVDFLFLIKPYSLLCRFEPLQSVLSRITPSHVRLYASRSFNTCYTDWMDRLFYPYVHYYTRDQALRWLNRENFTERSILTLGSHGLIVRGTGPA